MTCAQATGLSPVSLVLGAGRAPRSEPVALEARGEVGASASWHVRMPPGMFLCGIEFGAWK
jgi:hypothetical protein